MEKTGAGGRSRRGIDEMILEPIKKYSEFFVNDPETFRFRGKSHDAEKIRCAAARHVFGKYKTPKFLERAWWNGGTFEERLIYICLATGQSLYKEFFKPLFTKKETHIFINCRHDDLDARQAKCYAIAMAECDNERNALRIARSKLTRKPLNAEGKEIVKFLAREPNIPKSNVIDDLCDYLEMRYREDENFRINGNGYTFWSLKKRMEQWHRDLRRLRRIGKSVWDGYPIDDVCFDFKFEGKQASYYFTQIKSSQRLQVEGNKMRNCVLSYKWMCESGRCSIWSVKLNRLGKWWHSLTVEVGIRGDKYFIMQARGLANRLPKGRETTYLNRFKEHLERFNVKDELKDEKTTQW